jgi:endonuclease/exonuclease/phosphatase family metal-dependent hydrolase
VAQWADEKIDNNQQHRAMTEPIKVISWNLWHRKGALLADVAALIEAEQPDLLFMQEAKQPLQALPEAVGGHVIWQPMQRRVYGLAVWSRHELHGLHSVPLPISPFPLRVPPRLAQLVQLALGETPIVFANVHLSHGQMLNRRQLLAVAEATTGPTVIVGDCNAVGVLLIPGFEEVGPMAATHRLRTRLDRCLLRDLSCRRARVLDRGPSDHHPIEMLIDRP